MSDDLALSVKNISKHFELHQERRYTLKERFVRGKPKGTRDFWALRDVSFDVKKGSFFGIVGHNGSGKSTALKILAGIYRPTSGEVTVNGNLRALLELGAGFHPELTGRQNIQLNASILGMSQREIRSSMDEIIEFAGIGDFIDSPVKVYSSGMGVRLGFAVAVKMEPEILIVDEILAVGDEEFQRKCHDYLFDLRRHGKTIVLVTHATSIVESMCDEAIWLDHGELRAQGPANGVVAEYIKQVNRDEARGAALSSVADDEGLRRGSGEVQVSSVDMLDMDGEPLAVLVADQPCTFRVQITAKEAVDEFSVGLGFFTPEGACIAMLDSKRTGTTESIRPGPAHIDVTFDPMPLRAGSYIMSAALVREAHVYDLLDKSLPLTVRGNEAGGYGFVDMPVRWSGLHQGRGQSFQAESGTATDPADSTPQGNLA